MKEIDNMNKLTMLKYRFALFSLRIVSRILTNKTVVTILTKISSQTPRVCKVMRKCGLGKLVRTKTQG